MQQLRPTDFREMWAHALTRTLALQQEINNRLEQADAQTVDLLGQIPALIEEVHGLFDETKASQIGLHQEMQKSVTESIQVLRSLQIDLVEKHNALTAFRVEVETRERNVEARERQFDNLGFFGKLFFWKEMKS